MRRIGRRYVRFILVNGRTPSTKSFCMFCCEPMHASYLREISTGLPFCDHDCYALYSDRWMLRVGQSTPSAGVKDHR